MIQNDICVRMNTQTVVFRPTFVIFVDCTTSQSAALDQCHSGPYSVAHPPVQTGAYASHLPRLVFANLIFFKCKCEE